MSNEKKKSGTSAGEYLRTLITIDSIFIGLLGVILSIVFVQKDKMVNFEAISFFLLGSIGFFLFSIMHCLLILQGETIRVPLSIKLDTFAGFGFVMVVIILFAFEISYVFGNMVIFSFLIIVITLFLRGKKKTALANKQDD